MVTPCATRIPMAPILRSVPLASAAPGAAAPLDPTRGDTEVSADRDHRGLQPADVAHDVDRIRQPDDRVPGDLARTVPGDLAATVDIDDRRAVERPLVRLGALACGVDRRVLQQDQRVGRLTRDDLSVDLPLQVPGLEVRDDAGTRDLEHPLRLRRRPPPLSGAVTGVRHAGAPPNRSRPQGSSLA